MTVARPLLALISLIILAGGIVLQFFVILSGTKIGTPEDQIYFLQADTSAINGAMSTSRWTYFSVCGVGANGKNANCSPIKAASPFNPVQNFGTTDGVPMDFVGTHMYYYLSRLAWGFYLVALFFAVISFLLSAFALCARLGAYITGFTTLLATFFQAITAALMTAWTVKARNVFKANNMGASLGIKAYGFTWGAFACFFLSTVLYCVSGGMSNNDSRKKSYFGRKSSTRSRGSFIDNESQRRVKEEYE
ncbi:protein sur7 [Acrodontium crateriforme]|uniref:Protein sur7 n=1 Tax=Acrodontium crateriforme TaxID=150365 RepID=A0AAQ3R4R9_9PEZI|nr:protein sur7 [Acrodontium crateriforme]